ncbi:chemotaxis protein CheD [Bacillus massiliglaciei]|uniref:chemotaxis protein CheD n=1 Tax=Bacillus massiliglaciei TaxID=1816693 RepID=UPI000A584F0D|nr:chemotaxis protein CheD [Bacillus massiliglaciei]
MAETFAGKVIKVGIADMAVVRSPDIIRTAGLGSCVGLVLFDKRRGVGALLHVMLPDSSLAKAGALNPAKFADTAIKEMISQLSNLGIPLTSLKAKMAGGAQMFQFSTGSDLMRIGPRNVEAVRKELSDLKIEIIAEDVGGNNGRTIEFNPENAELHIRTVNEDTKII